MVEGAKVILTSQEISTHLQKRVDYHLAKMDHYKDQAKKLNEDWENAKSQFANNSSSFPNPAEAARARASEHEVRASFLKFFLDHISLADYLLTQNDLTELEFIKSRY
jgi:hypothetical protein